MAVAVAATVMADAVVDAVVTTEEAKAAMAMAVAVAVAATAMAGARNVVTMAGIAMGTASVVLHRRNSSCLMPVGCGDRVE